MTRGRAAAFAVLFTVLGTLVVLAPAVLLSWRIAVRERQEELDRTAALTLTRADDIYADAATVLRSIDGTDFGPCSPEHIWRMAQLTLRSLTVHAIAYGAGGFAICNESGPLSRRVPLQKFDSVQPDGIGLVVNWRGWKSGREPNLVMVLGNHRVLVDQRQFYGPPFARSPPFTMTVSTHDGVVLKSSFEELPAASASDETPMTSEVRSANWVVSASAPPIGFAEYLSSHRARLALLATGAALILAALAAWLLWRRQSPRGELELAVRNREFVVHYQPIIELATGRCVGAEALVRWQRGNGEIVRPDLFIPLAEETGLIRPITDQVVETIVSDLGDAMIRDRAVRIAINICADDISSGRIISVLDRVLLDSGIGSNQIWVEATERSVLDVAAAEATFSELRHRGYSVAIDDFGTGYSSLRYIQELPVDALKIDRIFVEALGTGAAASHVTDHIISMAREMKLRLVAEGVETKAQLAILQQQDVQYAQGWLFSAALPCEQFLDFCRHNRTAYGAPVPA